MRRSAIPIALALCLVLPAPALARGLENLKAGFNGFVTAVADPVLYLHEPPEDLEDLPGGGVTAHIAGAGAGTLMMVYRASMGLVDVAVTPLWVFPVLSPEPELTVVEAEYF